MWRPGQQTAACTFGESPPQTWRPASSRSTGEWACPQLPGCDVHHESLLPVPFSSPVNAVSWSLSGEYVVSVDKSRRAVLWSDF